MVTLLKLMIGIGGLVSLLGGLALIVFGEQLRARDARAGRVNDTYPTPEAQRRLAYTFVAIGAVCLILLFVF